MSVVYKNIFHMLIYVFDDLKIESLKNIAVENFENVEDIYAFILECILSRELKRGIYKDYNDKSELLNSIKGKINLVETIKPNSLIYKKVFCEFDDYNENTIINQIIKKTLFILLNSRVVSNKHKKKIKRLLFYFKSVDLKNLIELKTRITYNSVNSRYKSIINFCYFILDQVLLTEDEGVNRINNILSEKALHKIYESFIGKYYIKHHKDKVNVRMGGYIDWYLDDSNADKFLPKMIYDVKIEDKASNKVLILDAKYYSNNANEHYGKLSLNSANLYQIYTYVNNYSLSNLDKEVSGMLLYAKTQNDIQPNSNYMMNGHEILVNTLDLNNDFENIKLELDNLLYNFLNYQI